MFRNILHTISARYIVAFLNLLLIFVNIKILGRDNIGQLGLIITSANLAVIFNSILCGNTIVYFMNRYNLRYVFAPAYVWAVLGSALCGAVMYLCGIVPEGYAQATPMLALLMTLFNANTLMLLGKDRVKSFNRVFILQGASMFALVIAVYYIAGCRSIKAYLFSMFLAYAIAYLASMILLIKHLRKANNRHVKTSFTAVVGEMLIYGLWSGVDNLAEGLTTRLNYYLIQNIGGYGNVGLWDSGTKIAESVNHISNSISYIEYNSVSKTILRSEQKRVTLQLFKLTYCTLTLVMTAIVCIPEWVYTEYLMTADFAGVRRIILGLSAGIVSYGSNRILSHYFIGSGNIRYSACCSICGLAVLLIAGLFLIPSYGIFGAALTSSIAYSCMLFFSISVFMRQTQTTFRELLPSKSDFRFK
jgi:O-antigen/teichoic acid export membrane protein